MTAVIISAVILLIILILLFVPSFVFCDFNFDEYGKKLNIKFRYAFFEYPVIPKKENTEKKNKTEKNKEKKKEKKYDVKKMSEDIKKYYRLFEITKEDILNVLVYAKKYAVKLDKFNFELVFDTEDPMHTGIITGTINGIIYTVVAFVDNNMGIDDWNVNITPLFENNNYFRMETDGIVKIKNVHIIVIAFKLLRIYMKIRRINKADKTERND